MIIVQNVLYHNAIFLRRNQPVFGGGSDDVVGPLRLCRCSQTIYKGTAKS